MPSPTYITPKEAQLISEKMGIDKSIPTIIKYAERAKYGHTVGGRWHIDKEKFTQWLKGKK